MVDRDLLSKEMGEGSSKWEELKEMSPLADAEEG